MESTWVRRDRRLFRTARSRQSHCPNRIIVKRVALGFRKSGRHCPMSGIQALKRSRGKLFWKKKQNKNNSKFFRAKIALKEPECIQIGMCETEASSAGNPQSMKKKLFSEKTQAKNDEKVAICNIYRQRQLRAPSIQRIELIQFHQKLS